jgi:hypothetical protein
VEPTDASLMGNRRAKVDEIAAAEAVLVAKLIPLVKAVKA